ncbi:MAG: LPS assembly lipoprotein LptE [Nitrospiraceae bacterium]|nr:LPS assembly lipoprotein LptE [Nitrospiraceae bacterium]
MKKTITLMLMLFALAVSSCGYSIQTKSDLPFQDIAIGRIDNKTFEPKLQDRFNTALAEMFAEYGFNVTGTARYRLEGEILKFELTPTAEQNLVAAQYEVRIASNFRLYDTQTRSSIQLMNVSSPFLQSFASTGKIGNVMASKETSAVAAMRDIARALVSNIVYNAPRDLATILMKADDITNAQLLAKRLVESKADPLSAYIFSRLSQAGQKALVDNSAVPNPALADLLAQELSALIQQGALYERERFAGVRISADADMLIASSPGGFQLIRLNRLLLYDAYPDAVKKPASVRY